jgi:hypothetical protein
MSHADESKGCCARTVVAWSMARNGTAANRRRGDGVIMPQSRVRGAGAIVRFGHQRVFSSDLFLLPAANLNLLILTPYRSEIS